MNSFMSKKEEDLELLWDGMYPDKLDKFPESTKSFIIKLAHEYAAAAYDLAQKRQREELYGTLKGVVRQFHPDAPILNYSIGPAMAD